MVQLSSQPASTPAPAACRAALTTCRRWASVHSACGLLPTRYHLPSTWNMKSKSAPHSSRRSSALASSSCCALGGQSPSKNEAGASSTMRATSDPGNRACAGGKEA